MKKLIILLTVLLAGCWDEQIVIFPNDVFRVRYVENAGINDNSKFHYVLKNTRSGQYVNGYADSLFTVGDTVMIKFQTTRK